MSKIHLYAEVLTNIRQISLYAALQTFKNEETKLEISSDKRLVTVLHDGESTSIYLPTEIAGTAHVEIPVHKKKEITVRLAIEDTSTLTSSNEDTRSVESPWPAQELSSDTAFKCKSCERLILKPGKVQVWQDLPSENWYEMMDYWHCHKPHEDSPNEHNHVAGSKGYAAASRVKAQTGTGFVDIGSFLLNPDDCAGLKVTAADDDRDTELVNCDHCDSFMGWHDSSLGGYRLHKSRLLVQTRNEPPGNTFPATTFICAQLLAFIESQATHKFVLHSDAATGHLIWVFNPDIHYSSSLRGPTAHRAMKVFYQHIKNPIEMLDANTSTLEELRIPLPLLEEFEEALREGTRVLPQSARKFQEWDVAVLDRYETLVSTDMDRNPLTQKASPVMERINQNGIPLWAQGIEGIEGLY